MSSPEARLRAAIAPANAYTVPKIPPNLTLLTLQLLRPGFKAFWDSEKSRD